MYPTYIPFSHATQEKEFARSGSTTTQFEQISKNVKARENPTVFVQKSTIFSQYGAQYKHPHTEDPNTYNFIVVDGYRPPQIRNSSLYEKSMCIFNNLKLATQSKIMSSIYKVHHCFEHLKSVVV